MVSCRLIDRSIKGLLQFIGTLEVMDARRLLLRSLISGKHMAGEVTLQGPAHLEGLLVDRGVPEGLFAY